MGEHELFSFDQEEVGGDSGVLPALPAWHLIFMSEHFQNISESFNSFSVLQFFSVSGQKCNFVIGETDRALAEIYQIFCSTIFLKGFLVDVYLVLQPLT